MTVKHKTQDEEINFADLSSSMASENMGLNIEANMTAADLILDDHEMATGLISRLNEVSRIKGEVRNGPLMAIKEIVAKDSAFLDDFRESIVLGMESSHLMTRNWANDVAINIINKNPMAAPGFLVQIEQESEGGFSHLKSDRDCSVAVCGVLDVAEAIVKERDDLLGRSLRVADLATEKVMSDRIKRRLESVLKTICSKTYDSEVESKVADLYKYRLGQPMPVISKCPSLQEMKLET